MNVLDLLLIVMQGAALVVSTALGFVSATTEPLPRSVRRTRVLLSIALTVGMVTLVTGAVREHRQATRVREAEATEAKRNADRDEKLNRLVQPVESVQVSARIDLPLDAPEFREFGAAMRSYAQRETKGSTVPELEFDLSTFHDLPLGRDWSGLSYEFTNSLTVALYRQGEAPPRCPTRDDGVLHIHFAPRFGHAEASYDGQSMTIEIENVDAEVVNSRESAVVALSDFSGATAVVWSNFASAKDSPEPTGTTSAKAEVRVPATLRRLRSLVLTLDRRPSRMGPPPGTES